MVQSSMKLFNRNTDKTSKVEVEPSSHFALIIVKNDHLQIEHSIDISALSFDQMDDLISYAQFMLDMQDITVEDFEYDCDHEHEDDETND